MTGQATLETDRTGEASVDGDDVPSVPPSIAAAITIAVLCGAISFAQSPAAPLDARRLLTADAELMIGDDGPEVRRAGRAPAGEPSPEGLAMEGWNAGVAEEARL